MHITTNEPKSCHFSSVPLSNLCLALELIDASIFCTSLMKMSQSCNVIMQICNKMSVMNKNDAIVQNVFQSRVTQRHRIIELQFYGPYQYFTVVTNLTQMPRYFMLPNGSFILQHMLCVLFSSEHIC